MIRYTTDHEWLRTEDDGTLTVGITDYAQEQLGDIVYVELPEAGREISAGELLVVIESVKAVGEIKMPCAATVRAINETLADQPELVNSDAVGSGWLARIEPADAGVLDALMDEDAYRAYLGTL